MIRDKKSFLGFLRYFFLGERYVDSEAEARSLAKSPGEHPWGWYSSKEEEVGK